MATYSYDPTKITENGVDQMRFELGDTVVDIEGVSSPLCDEEYTAILDKYGQSWRKAKMKCLEAIVMKFSYEVNTSVGGLSYSLDHANILSVISGQKKMYDEAKKEEAAMGGLPLVGCPDAISGAPYFYNDMQANIRKF